MSSLDRSRLAHPGDCAEWHPNGQRWCTQPRGHALPHLSENPITGDVEWPATHEGQADGSDSAPSSEAPESEPVVHRMTCRCGRPNLYRGMCVGHYQRWRRHGDPMWDVPLGGAASLASSHCIVCGAKSLRGCERCGTCLDIIGEAVTKAAAPFIVLILDDMAQPFRQAVA